MLNLPVWIFFITGLIIGSSYFVTPSACYEIETSDEMDRPELNAQSAMKASL